MKKLLLLIGVVALFLVGCGGKKESKLEVIKVGATPVPHTEILNHIKEDLKTAGYELQIVQFTDYVTPNIALNDGEIDANFFQHIPYMEEFAKEKGFNLFNAANIHIEPLGLYSKKYKALADLPEKAVIAIPSDGTNGGRALLMLHTAGLIKLKDGNNLLSSISDIVENPKGYEFKALEAAQLPRVLADVDAGVINGNYALDSKLNPVKDAILLEGKDSPYVNIITVIKGKESDKKIQALVKALHTEKVKKFILEKYEGGVVPAF